MNRSAGLGLRLGLIALLALGGALGGCKKEEKKDDAPSAEKAVDKGKKDGDKGAGETVIVDNTKKLGALSAEVEMGLADRGSDVAQRMLGAAKLAPSPLFAYIPADTPYLFASFEPLSPAMYASLMESFSAFDPLIAKALAEPVSSDPGEKVSRALLEELKGKLNPKGMEELGFSTSPQFAIYGLGPAPVIRISLSSGERLRAALTRIETKAATKIPFQKSGEIEYIKIEDGSTTTVISILKDQLVVALMPKATFDRALPVILGTEKPANAMTTGEPLKKVISQHGFASFGVGYLDFGQLWAGVNGKGTGVTGDMWKAAKPPKAMPAPCSKAMDETITRFPKLAFGFDELTASAMSVTAVLEMEPKLAKDLAGISVGVPGLTSRTGVGAKLAFGYAMSFAPAKELGKRFAAELQAVGKACDVNEWSEVGQSMAGSLAQPLPPFAADVKGLVAVVMDGKFQTSGPPAELQGYAVLVIKDPATLVGMAKQQTGMQFELPADGKFHPLNLGLPKTMVESVVGAIKGDRLVLAGGAKGASAAEKLLDAPASPSPLVFFSWDMAEIMKLAKDKMKTPKNDAEKAGQDLVKNHFNKLGAVGMWLYTAQTGLGVRMRMEYKKP